MNINLMSANVRGINDFKKRRSIFNWIQKHNADIAFLQEVYSSPEIEKQWRNEWGGEILYTHGTKHSRGAMILIRKNFDCEVMNYTAEISGRIQILQIKIDDSITVLINVYAPCQENQQINFLKSLLHLIEKEKCNDHNMIICGDFNVTLNPVLDKKGGHQDTKEKSRKELKGLMEILNLTDIWRLKNPTKKKFTWRQPKPLIQCRLDFFLISESMEDSITSADILPAYKSDHSAITLSIKDISCEKRGPGYWKLNTKLLEDERYTTDIKNNIMKWHSECPQFNNRQKWEYIKYQIRKYSIEHSKKLAKEKKDLTVKLEQRVQELEMNLNQENMKEYDLLKKELETCLEEKVEGTILRAKVRWYEESERSTKYFFNLEKRNYGKKTMRKLLLNDNYTTDPKVILREQRNFYETLYSTTKTNTFETKRLEDKFLNTPNLPKLDIEDTREIGTKLTINECYKSLKTFQPNKSPGNDGIPAEFLRYFWPELGKIMVASFNEAYEEGLLTTSQRQAVITLIDKKDKDRTLLKNWRPISLLNVDYKVASKALANRIIPLLPKVIHPDQSGYVKGRNMSDSLRSILDILSYTEKQNLSGILLSLDFQKAFDTLEWDFMLKTLKAFNFGEGFIRWVKLLYTDVSSCVMNNGYSSGFFKVSRGVRQGDPMSPYLFILSLEILSHKIRNDPNIEGIKIGDSEKKLFQYADDTSPILKDDKSVPHLLKTLDEFAVISGLKINQDKTEWMRIGSTKFSKKSINDFPPIQTSLKLLGVHICHDINEMIKKNFDSKITELQSTFNLWKMRNLTIEGRIFLTKSLGISKFNHLITILPVPEDYIKRIETCFYQFVWNSKRDKVKRSILINNYAKGGLRMPHLQSVIHKCNIRWIQKYLNDSSATWKDILDEYLKKFGGTNLFILCNYDTVKLQNYLPPFYVSVFKTWKPFIHSTSDLIKNPFVWNNENIKMGNSTLYNDTFFKAGLWYTSDLYETNMIIPFNTWVNRGVPKSLYHMWYAIVNATRKLKNSDKASPDYLRIKILGKEKNFMSVDTQYLYWHFVSQASVDGPSCKTKWEEKFTNLHWTNIHLLARKTTTNKKLHQLQYRIINRYLTTNQLLKTYSIVTSDRCSKCLIHKETLEHLLWECEKSKNIWFKFEKWWKDKTGLNDYPTPCEKTVIFGSLSKLKHEQLYNHIILIIKQYLFQTKEQGHNFDEVVNNVKLTRKIEYYIAKKNNMLIKHLKKWEILNL